MSFKSLCKKYFGTSDFYEVLGTTRRASPKEIKKAYHRMSLLVHPDRVEEHQKKIATEKFKALGRIHSILTDESKKRRYDEVGDFDEDHDASCNWMDYWRSMFKKIDLKDIEDYKEQYVGSETELRDIKKAYLAGKGNMNVILELVPFSNIDSEPRIIELVEKMVEDEEVPKYSAFFNENPKKKKRRHDKLLREKEEVEQIEMAELEKKLEENSRKRASDFQKLIEKYSNNETAKKRKSITDGNVQAKKKGRK